MSWEGTQIRPSKKIRMNRQIRVPEVRLIDAEGNQLGVVRTAEAQSLANEAGMDLVEISPNAIPPVCRIMDYGKFQFDQKKKLAAQKKKQKQTEIKEVKFRPVTDIGDYKVKLRKIATFLDRGDKVKVTLRFRGREMQHRELGMDLLGRVKRDLENIVVESEPRLEGRQMTMLLGKGKGEKVEVKEEISS